MGATTYLGLAYPQANFHHHTHTLIIKHFTLEGATIDLSVHNGWLPKAPPQPIFCGRIICNFYAFAKPEKLNENTSFFF